MKYFVRIVLVLAILLLALAAVAYLNANRIAEWAFARRLPDAKISIGSLVLGLNHADAKKISAKHNLGTLLFEDLQLKYSLRGLRLRQIEQISARGITLTSANTTWRLSAPGFHVSFENSNHGEGWLDQPVIEFFGQTLADCRSARAVFDIASFSAERIGIQQPRVNLWEDSEGVWNFERLRSLSGTNATVAARAERGSSQGPRSAPAVTIQSLVVRDGQVVLGRNKSVQGLLPIMFELSLRDINTADWSMTGDGIAHLPACDANVTANNPTALHGISADTTLKFGTAGEFVTATGTATVGRVTCKGVNLDSVLMPFRSTSRLLQSTNLTAQFSGSPVTGFVSVYLNGRPIGYSLGAECKDLDLDKLTAAMVPDRLRADGRSYLYLESAGNAQQPVTWAALKFQTINTGTVAVKKLPELLSASNLSADQQQLFLLAFDRGEVLPYKTAWLNADLFGGKLTVATFFERQAKLFFGLEVHPPPFEVPLEVLKEKGWMP